MVPYFLCRLQHIVIVVVFWFIAFWISAKMSIPVMQLAVFLAYHSASASTDRPLLCFGHAFATCPTWWHHTQHFQTVLLWLDLLQSSTGASSSPIVNLKSANMFDNWFRFQNCDHGLLKSPATQMFSLYQLSLLISVAITLQQTGTHDPYIVSIISLVPCSAW